MIIKIFENFDEELEHLKDILVDVKDVGYWDYKMFNGENYKPSIDINNLKNIILDKNILKEEVKYKILFQSNVEYDVITHYSEGDLFDDQMIKILNTCISYMSEYNYFLTQTSEDDHKEYLIDLDYLSSVMYIDRYFKYDYIILRFTKE